MAQNQQEIYQVHKAQIFSVKEARKIMGIVSNKYNDDEVKDIVSQLLVLAEVSGKAAHEQVFKKSVPKST